jgi:DHA1 family bicyclomycin/chloramphenicol resistance-like MFS transporter
MKTGSSGAMTTAPVSRRDRVLLVVILGALTTIGPLSIDMYLPGLPEIGRSLDASPSAVQLTLTACVAGLALGQLVAGPLSDRIGRRGPLLVSTAVYAAASLACSLAPTVYALMGLRFLQGLAGAAGLVISRAIVRDLHTGAAAVRLFSSLMLVVGLAPILAPVIGGQLLAHTSWRGIFVVLAGLAVLILFAGATQLRETLPVERRNPAGMRETLGTMRGLLRQRTFMGYALSCSLAFGAMFAYISGSPFVLQDIYGASPQLYSVFFALNGLGLVGASQINARVVGRFGPSFLLHAAIKVIAVCATLIFCVVSFTGLGVWAVLLPLFFMVSSLAFVMPNSTALALADHAEVAGAASALLGVVQFLVGAIAAPLVGIAGTETAVPMGLVMATLSVGSVVVLRLLVGRGDGVVREVSTVVAVESAH